MGNCATIGNCMQSETSSEQVQLSDRSLPQQKKQQEIPKEEAEIVTNTGEILEAEPLQRDPKILEALICAIRTYQSRKAMPPPRPIVSKTVSKHMPSHLSLLSKIALKVYDRLPQFTYDSPEPMTTTQPAVILEDGSVYEGEWITADEQGRNGRGKLFGADGSFREGYWKEGKMNGVGRVIEKNGDFYEGGFQDGERSGSGTFESYSGALTYSGQWFRDLYNGLGHENSNGIRYEGPFTLGHKSGKGKLFFPDGGEYVGEVVDGEMEGMGTFLWKDGRRFVGMWRKGKMHGLGYFTSEKGITKRFEFVNGVRGKEVPEGTQ